MIIDKFVEKQTKIMRGIRDIDPTLTNAGANALIESVQQSDYIYFDPTTMAMLRDKYQHYDEVIAEVHTILVGTLPGHLSEKLLQKASSASFPGGFIWFSEPLHKDDKIEALYFYHVQDRHGHDAYNLLLITTEGDVEYVLEAGLGEPWSFVSQIHRCSRCSYDRYNSIVRPCEVCGLILSYWSEILVLSTIIAGQYLAAKKYIEKKVPVTRPQMAGGRNVSKKRAVEYLIKTVHADEMFIAVPTEEYIAHHPPGTTSSWVEAALAAGDLEYVKVTTRSFDRIYHTKDRGDITYTFTKGVEQNRPMRKSYAGKRITQVTAPSYAVKKEGEDNEHE